MPGGLGAGKGKTPKEEKAEAPGGSSENGMGDPSVSFSKPKKKKSFSKEELVSNDLEETTGTGSLPKWKKSIPKEEQLLTLMSQKMRVPRKKWNLSSKEEPLSSGPGKAAVSKSSGSKKKRKL